MITRSSLALAVLFSGALAHAEEANLDRLPLPPGAYRVDGKSDASCRPGPGGKSLVVESAELLAIFTAENGIYRADLYGADGVARFEGKLDGATLTLAGATGKLALVPESGAVTLRLETAKQKKVAKWTRVPPATTSGVATGIGGVFMRAKDAKKLREWYAQHLGLALSPYGFVDFRWRELADPSRIGHTAWATFKPESTHFDGPFMINYRVDHLDVLLKKLQAEGVKVERTQEDPGTGHFAWIRDGEGQLVELWEPAGN